MSHISDGLEIDFESHYNGFKFEAINTKLRFRALLRPTFVQSLDNRSKTFETQSKG